jgi:hypothetical protein
MSEGEKTEADKKPGLFTMAWFKPLYRRVIVCLIPVAALVFELIWGKDQFWMLIWAAGIAYGVWSFFINFDKELAKAENDAKPKS